MTECVSEGRSSPSPTRSRLRFRPFPAAMGLSPRKDETERRTMAGNTAHLDAAAVKLDERLHQAKPQADSSLAELEIARRMMKRVETCEEGLEQVLLLAGVNADSFILDDNTNPLRIARNACA